MTTYIIHCYFFGTLEKFWPGYTSEQSSMTATDDWCGISLHEVVTETTRMIINKTNAVNSALSLHTHFCTCNK